MGSKNMKQLQMLMRRYGLRRPKKYDPRKTAQENLADPERRREHERDCWNAIQAALADRYPGADMGDLFDDHGAAIVAAMYKAAG